MCNTHRTELVPCLVKFIDKFMPMVCCHLTLFKHYPASFFRIHINILLYSCRLPVIEGLDTYSPTYSPRQFTWRLHATVVILTPLDTAWFKCYICNGMAKQMFICQIIFWAAVSAPLLLLHTAHTARKMKKCYSNGSRPYEQSMRRD